ncbi:50S ribosomal protein L25/general stress protein Ctc [Desulfococcaceae bacterium HSG8]|nr:50S ribosomal protein L25/general stress protein Ctc [Desulfococcaceae bacterium HSG8]
MELVELNANVRTAVGKGQARVLRREGKIPAVLYGPGTDPTLLSVDIKAFEDAIKNSRKSQGLLNLVIQNGEARPSMIKELQAHPVSRDFIHADFYEVSMDRKIRVMVPVRTKGKCIGVELGGMLQIVRRELEVLCFPHEIPEAIEIDITELDMAESIHVREIPLEGNIEIPADVNFTVATILSGRIKSDEDEEEETEEEGEEAAEAAE